MTVFTPRPVHRLRQQVEEQIVEAIVTGRLAKGQRLPSEIELSESFSVSRATIREVLRSLAAAGLIDKVPGATGGSFVQDLDATRFGQHLTESINLLLQVGSASRAEVGAVREMLEVPSCRLAALHRTEEQLEALYEIVDQQSSRRVDDPDVPDLDVDFHGAIAEATGNRILYALVRAAHAVNLPVRHLALDPRSGRDTVKQHLEIVHAIERQDSEAAADAIRQHLSYLTML